MVQVGQGNTRVGFLSFAARRSSSIFSGSISGKHPMARLREQAYISLRPRCGRESIRLSNFMKTPQRLFLSAVFLAGLTNLAVQAQTPPAQNTSPVHQNTSPPAQNTSPAHQNTTPPAQNSTPPAQHATPPPQNTAPSAQNMSPPTQQTAPPAQHATPPAQNMAPPAQNVSPPPQNVSPAVVPSNPTAPGTTNAGG